MDRRELLRRLARNPHNVRFRDFVGLIEGFGFRLARSRGSHHIFSHESIPHLVNIQEVGGEAKAYQVRQFLKLVERYNLTLEEDGEMKDYHINIFWSDEDEAYVADIPDLEYCSALGKTPEEALAQLEIAKDLWMEAAREKGVPIPPPSYRPVIYQAAR